MHIQKNKLLFELNKFLSFKYDLEKRDILKIKLRGGLCNKLLCFFAACELAQKNNYQLLEPAFGWHKKILFSDIYDMDYFNAAMSEHFGGKNILIPFNASKDKRIRKRIRYDIINLWHVSEKYLSYLRTNRIVESNSMMVHVLKSLKLNPQFDHILRNNFISSSISDRKGLGHFCSMANSRTWRNHIDRPQPINSNAESIWSSRSFFYDRWKSILCSIPVRWKQD